MAKPIYDFHWNYGVAELINRKGCNDALNYFFAKEMLERAEEITPMKTGQLRQSASINVTPTGAEINYGVPYANYQYFLSTPNRTTPGTDGFWFEEVWTTEKASIVGKVGAERRRLSK